MRLRRQIAIAAVVATGCLPGSAFADTIVLDNGDRISGNFVEVRDGRIHFEPDYGDEALAIALERITRLETDDPIRLLLEDGTEVRGRAVESEADGQIRLENDEFVDPLEFSITQLDRVTSYDTPVREPVRTSGNVLLGGRITDGNTRTRAFNASADASVRSDVNRYRFNAEFNRAQEDGRQSEDNAAGSIRYDHFVTERLYLNTNVYLARRRFRDLRLRTSAGGGLGYQFFDTDQRILSAEVGLSYVNEDYFEAPNEDNPAGRWAIDYEQRFAGNGIRIFHTQEGLTSLENAEDTVISTRTGIRFPFVVGMTGTFQINHDYDNNPPADQRRIDTAFILTAGYTW